MHKKCMSIIAVVALAAIYVQAAALTDATATPYRPGASVGYLQTTGSVVYGGAIAAISTTTGKIVPATDTTASMMVVGCVARTSDNGGIDASRLSATRKAVANRGVFRWANGDSFVAADVGQTCYIYDDHTVAKAGTTTYDIPVGVIVEVDDNGVWVDTTILSKILSGSLTTATISGNATVGGTLDVTGAETAGSTLTVTGLLRGNGGFNTDGGTFSVADTTGNTIVGGTLNVTGATTLGAVTHTGALICTNPVTMTGIPTATNGLTTGRVWANANVLTLMP